MSKNLTVNTNCITINSTISQKSSISELSVIGIDKIAVGYMSYDGDSLSKKLKTSEWIKKKHE